MSKTKDEPRKNQGTTKELRKNSQPQKSTFIKIAVSFPSLIPCLILPREERETTDRTTAHPLAHKKCCFLRLLPNKVVLIPKKVDSFPKTVDYIPKIVAYPPNKKSLQKYDFSCSIQKSVENQIPVLKNTEYYPSHQEHSSTEAVISFAIKKNKNIPQNICTYQKITIPLRRLRRLR